ncbi:PDC sensor domain-containing protein [Vibrio sp. PP-XX7]
MTLYQDAPDELLMSLQHEQTKRLEPNPIRTSGGVLSVPMPLYDADGIFVGVLAMDLELKHYDHG